MSYCDPTWVSDYHFSNALRHRLRIDTPPASPTTALLLWGGTDTAGAPYLEPAFVLHAPPRATGLGRRAPDHWTNR